MSLVDWIGRESKAREVIVSSYGVYIFIYPLTQCRLTTTPITTNLKADMDQFDEFQQLLHYFRCERLPLDLFTRATAERSSWSPSGEITSVSPQRHGVPLWFIDFWVSHSPIFEQDGALPGLGGFCMVSEGGFRYLERQDEESVCQPDDAADHRVCLAECLAIMVHAFPCINSEVLVEELVSMFMPLAKTFLLPLLAAVTSQDVDDWLLPQSDEL